MSAKCQRSVLYCCTTYYSFSYSTPTGRFLLVNVLIKSWVINLMIIVIIHVDYYSLWYSSCWVGGTVLIACVIISFPLSGPTSDSQFSVEENENSYSGKTHHRHRRHTHSQDTLCHTHTKNSKYCQPEENLHKSVMWCLDTTLMPFPFFFLHVCQHHKALVNALVHPNLKGQKCVETLSLLRSDSSD